jgi:hypothetical protein
MRTVQRQPMILRSLTLAGAASLALAAESPAALPTVSLDVPRPIRDDPKVDGRMRVTGGFRDRIGIELRGQSSQTFPKKSYAVELRGEDAGLLGMPADDDWVLYAAYNDKTLMRNVVAYETARFTGRWAAQTRFVHLRLNGRYQGVYVLMERVELSDERVDGDTLLEFTFPYQARRKGPHFLTPVRRRPIVWEEPDREDLSAQRARRVRGLVARTERALYRSSPTWRRTLDEASAVDFLLVQELFRNVDAFHASTFLVEEDGRLSLGPVWDFDLSSGNSTSGRSRLVRGWATTSRDWSEKLWDDRAFRGDLRRRWRELQDRGLRAAVLGAIDAAQRDLRGSTGRNFRRWPILDRRVWQNPAARGSHGAEVRYLRSWLSRRMAWMDRALGR